MQLPVPQLLEQLARLDQRYAELERQIAEQAGRQPDPQAYQQLSKELSDLREVVTAYRTYQRIEREAREAEAMWHAQGDLDVRELAKEEAVALRLQQTDLLADLERQWLERTQEPERPLIVEIRAGTGGQEASLFVADLYRMYSKYAAKCGLSVEPLQAQRTESGGLKEMSFAVKGAKAWPYFKHESGVHRVQRVPQTEAQGRIHTSTVTVAVLPEPEEVELSAIPAKELQIDVYRSSGPGGQSVNTTDSAVRIRHIPTGLVVTCQDERSQLRNKEKAMRVLRARLLDQFQHEQRQQIASDRRKQVGTGERSEKIRTYNFPDRRITDHRIGLTLHQLDLVMEGEMQPLVDALLAAERAKGLEAGS
ncbi:MAG: peptide chain release factor 1 [Candidatus Omnitrophica bacterium CG11_big_fil_rev_8_21_14_0_20_63_9]|nr:MAG: peptide chain release factor 1 [Candidatus Omnitrophica bacterium CG11_big_fil_rev_8_21_14_0_20_63_9]